MKRFLETILFIALGIAFCLGIGKLCQEIDVAINNARQQGRLEGLNTPQSIGETQKILKRLGYYQGSIDYKWGPLTERAYCDWCASESFKRMAEKE